MRELGKLGHITTAFSKVMDQGGSGAIKAGIKLTLGTDIDTSRGPRNDYRVVPSPPIKRKRPQSLVQGMRRVSEVSLLAGHSS
jgi:hypothetical protein